MSNKVDGLASRCASISWEVSCAAQQLAELLARQAERLRVTAMRGRAGKPWVEDVNADKHLAIYEAWAAQSYQK